MAVGQTTTPATPTRPSALRRLRQRPMTSQQLVVRLVLVGAAQAPTVMTHRTNAFPSWIVICGSSRWESRSRMCSLPGRFAATTRRAICFPSAFSRRPRSPSFGPRSTTCCSGRWRPGGTTTRWSTGKSVAGACWDIVTGNCIIDVVADLLGDSVILRHSHLFAKLPGDTKRVSWRPTGRSRPAG